MVTVPLYESYGEENTAFAIEHSGITVLVCSGDKVLIFIIIFIIFLKNFNKIINILYLGRNGIKII